jgi:alpha-glucosidase
MFGVRCFSPLIRLAVALGAIVSVPATFPVSATAQTTEIASPSGNLRFKLQLDSAPTFEITLNNQPVIEKSRFGFSIDGSDLLTGSRAGDIKQFRLNESYPWRGVHSVASNNCNGATIALQHGQTGYTLEVRVFDDGAAFRFVLPGNAAQSRVPDETSSFVVPPGSRVWHYGVSDHYEGTYSNTPVADIPAGQWVAPPMTYKLPGTAGYASITEADLVNYSGMALQADGRRGFTTGLAHKQPPSHPFVLRYGTNAATRLAHAAAITGPITTPWRVVLAGADLNALVNSDVIIDLCPPPDPKYFPQGFKTDWIRPGRAVWKYLDGGTNTIEGTKEFCRAAGQLGFEYDVIEGYWSRWTDAEIRDVVSYARQQNVGLIVWKHSRSLRTPEAREAFFKRLHDLGIAGAKIDFFDHEHKELIDLYQQLLELGAKYHILLVFHGSDKPTGTTRTWPNELTREAIRGMESRRLKDRATHDVILPFTRYLAGPGDYTVMHFGDRRGNTTWAHQIASAAVFEMPLITYAANPKTILAQPAADLIKSIPTAWDETLVLPPSEIGQVAVFARRSGERWFLSVLNGPEARVIQVPLSFLGPDDYRAQLVRDSGNSPAAEQIENRTVHRGDVLTINLRAGGGFIGRFTRN